MASSNKFKKREGQEIAQVPATKRMGKYRTSLVAFRTTVQMVEALNEVSKKHGLSKSEVIIRALAEYLEKPEMAETVRKQYESRSVPYRKPRAHRRRTSGGVVNDAEKARKQKFEEAKALIEQKVAEAIELENARLEAQAIKEAEANSDDITIFKEIKG